MSKDLDLDDILGEAIDTVAGDVKPTSQNDKDGVVQNDTDFEADFDIGLDIDELGDALNAVPDQVTENEGLTEEEEKLDVLADLGIDLSDDEPFAKDDADDQDVLNFLDGQEGLVTDDDEEIDVDSLIGQAKGDVDQDETGAEIEPIDDEDPIDKEMTVEPSEDENTEEVVDEFDLLSEFESDAVSASEATKESDDPEDGFDPLSEFGDEKVEDEEVSSLPEDSVIEPDFEDTDLNNYEGEEEEVAVIEPDIIDGFMQDDLVEEEAFPEDDSISEEDPMEDDDMIDISSDEPVVKEKSNKTSFKPHTEVEDVESLLNGGVSGIFEKPEKVNKRPETNTDEAEESLEEISLPTSGEEEEPVETPPAHENKAKAETKNASNGGFGVKAIILTAVSSVMLSLGVGGGLLYAFGDKLMSNDSYVDNTVFEQRMGTMLEQMEQRLSEKTKTQATKNDVQAELSKMNSSVDEVMARYDSEFGKLQEQLQIVLNKQDIDKSEMEALNRKSLLLLNQFVDDTKAAQAKVSEEVYAKVVKVVREEFSNRDNTVKLDEVLSQVSALRSDYKEIANRVQTQMNLIGVLESEGDFLSKRMATLEVGVTPDVKPQASGKTPLKTGYTDAKGDSWLYLEIETKDGTASGSHYKHQNPPQNDPAKTSPYVLKGVFLTGTQDNPEYKVYVTPRASENATPIGYKIGQQIPGMGKILKVEPTTGNEKVPYLVYTDLGVLRGEQ